MEQRDIIKDQIEKIGMILARLLEGFNELKEQGKISEAIEVSNRILSEKMELEVEQLMNYNQQELESYFDQRKLTPENIEHLSDYFIELGEYEIKLDKDRGTNVLKQALIMYKILDSKSTLFSFSRLEKEDRIHYWLNS